MTRCSWFLPDLTGGGAQRLPLILAPAMRDVSVEVVLLKEAIEHALPPQSPRILSLGPKDVTLRRVGARTLVRATRVSHRSDVSVAGLEWAPTFFAAAAAALARRPLVATVHVPLDRYAAAEPVPAWWWPAMRWSLARTAAVIAVSDDAAASAYSLGAVEERISVIGHPAPSLPARAHPFPSTTPHLLTVAGLRTVKGIDVALRAARDLDDLDFVWTFVGDGPQRAELEQLAAAYGLTGKVVFAGFQPDPDPYYRAADLFVLSSRTEGGPLVALEAGAHGLPIVSSNVSAWIEAALGVDDGLVVPVADHLALAQAIRGLLGDRQRWELACQRSRMLAEGRTTAAIAPRYEQVLMGVVETTPRGRR